MKPEEESDDTRTTPFPDVSLLSRYTDWEVFERLSRRESFLVLVQGKVGEGLLSSFTL